MESTLQSVWREIFNVSLGETIASFSLFVSLSKFLAGGLMTLSASVVAHLGSLALLGVSEIDVSNDFSGVDFREVLLISWPLLLGELILTSLLCSKLLLDLWDTSTKREKIVSLCLEIKAERRAKFTHLRKLKRTGQTPHSYWPEQKERVHVHLQYIPTDVLGSREVFFILTCLM